MIDIPKLNPRFPTPRHPSDSSSSLAIVPSSRPPWSTAKFHTPLNLPFQRCSPQLALLLNSQPSLMAFPPPDRDQPLLKSLLTHFAQSCYWSSLIRPLILLILAHQLGYVLPAGPSSKLFNQLECFFKKSISAFRCPLNLALPPPKSSSPLRISAAPPTRKKIRLAKAFKCSGLVDSCDSSIQHQHHPPPSYLKRSNACRTTPRSRLFLWRPAEPVTQLELERMSMLALCQMKRSPHCVPEDGLDGDQRHQRYYLVNSYRAKLASSVASKTQSTHSLWQADADDEEGLEPLEDLLDWDSSTRII